MYSAVAKGYCWHGLRAPRYGRKGSSPPHSTHLGTLQVGREAGTLCEACAFQAPLGRALCRARVAFCIHNLAYQGVLPTAAFPQLCLPPAALASLQQPQAHGAVQQSASPGEAEAEDPSQACAAESTFTGQDDADIEQEEPDHSLSATKQMSAEATIVQLDHAAATYLNWMHVRPGLG